VVLLCITWLAGWCASIALAADPNVMVHGGGRTTGPNPVNPVWVANYPNDPKDPAGPGTQILYREKIGDDKWQEFSRIGYRVAGITSESSELVLLSENRVSWAWFSGSGSGTRFSYGPELPDHQKILAIAGDRKALWAIGLASARTTQPATMPATRPTWPVLHQYSTDGWQALDAPWPEGIVFNNPNQVSMAIVNEVPTVAINTGDRFIHLLQYSRTARRWEKMKEKVENTPRPQWFKLLNLADQPAVWIWAEGDGGLGVIWTANRIMKLPEGGGIEAGDADVTVAGDMIWLVYRTNQGKLLQQRFNLDGSRADEKATEVNFLRANNNGARNDWITIGAMTMLTLLFLIALLRRRAAAKGDDEEESED